MKLDAGRLPGALERQLQPAYLVCGDEPLLVGEARDAIVAAARSQGFDQRELHVAERGFGWDDLAAGTRALGLFAERRIIDLRLPTGKPGDRGSRVLTEYLAAPEPDILLIVSAPRLAGRDLGTRWAKAIDSAGAIVRVWPVEARDLPAWIEQRLARAGLGAERDAVLQMARRVEGNLLAAQQEIDKLALLYPGETVAADAMQAAVADNTRFDVFRLADEVLAGRTQRALRMLDTLRREGVATPLVLWALVRELRGVIQVAEALAAGQSMQAAMSEARVWQNRQAVVRAAVQRLEPRFLHHLLGTAERADARAKGRATGDAWEAITELTFGLSSGQPLYASG